jgi:flagellar protein FlaG
VNISSISQRSVASPPSEGARESAPVVQVIAGNEAPIAAVAAEKNPSSAQVSQAVRQVNDAFAQKGQNLYASLEKDKETGIHVVKLLDKNTKEVVSQYPSKEIVAIAAAITQYQESKGQLLDINV